METKTTSASFGTTLLAQIGNVLADPSTLHDFRQWFTSALWESESMAPDDILALAYRIENLLGIVDAGIWSEAEFIDHLGAEMRDRFGWRVEAPDASHAEKLGRLPRTA